MSKTHARAAAFLAAADKAHLRLSAAQKKTIDALRDTSVAPGEMQRRLRAARTTVEGAIRDEIATHRRTLDDIRDGVFCRTCPESPSRRSARKRARAPAAQRAGRKATSPRPASRRAPAAARSRRTPSPLERRMRDAQASLDRSPNAPGGRLDLMRQIRARRQPSARSASANARDAPTSRLDQFRARPTPSPARGALSKAPAQSVFAAINKGQFNLKPVTHGVRGKPVPDKKPRSGVVGHLHDAIDRRRRAMSPSRSAASRASAWSD